LTESHPLIAHLERRGIPVEYRALSSREKWSADRPVIDRAKLERSQAPVDLLTFRPLVIMLAAAAVAGLAAALHFTLLPPIRPLWSPDHGALLLAGSGVFVAGAALSNSVPVRERTVVALLLGATVALLAHPLYARVLSLTGEEPFTADYVVEAPGRFAPIDPNHPALDLRDLDIDAYWASLPSGTLHAFELQQVGEERFILRLETLFERTRAFFSSRESP
jgi:hypothetical protein